MCPVGATDPLVQSEDDHARHLMGQRSGLCLHSRMRRESDSSASRESSLLTPRILHTIARAIAGAFAPIARGTWRVFESYLPPDRPGTPARRFPGRLKKWTASYD
jgi:hypothetical protein